jgi:hypothetical protein
MKQEFIDLSIKLHHKPLDAGDLASLRAHAEAVRKSESTARQLKDAEHVIVFATMGQLYKKYPQKIDAYWQTEAKTLRDMKLVMRYCLYGVVLNDPEWPKQKMFWWFRTILNAFEFGKDFIEDAYRMAQQRTLKALGAEEGPAISRMIDVAIDTFNYDPIADRQAGA